MQKTASPRLRREWRKCWAVLYQDALGTPEDDILVREFATENTALAWADESFVVPLWLEEREQLIGDNGKVLGTITERHEI